MNLRKTTVWFPSLEPELQELIGVHRAKKERSFKVEEIGGINRNNS